MITVPQVFATTTVNREGNAGRKWIDALPGVIEDLCQQWNLTVDGPVMHGYLALVIPVRSAAEPCVLKVSWIDESTIDEAIALSAWNGQGAVRLLTSQPAPGALLLERLDHRWSLNDVGIAEAVEVACRLLRRLSIPAPVGLRPLQIVMQDLCRILPDRWKRYGHPLPRHLLDRACDLAIQLGASTGNLLVNYDLHYADVLMGKREPWLVVDPKVGRRRS
ncbi:MAG TPA: aminoglycoside phosphotransferase family protein [Ktedonosporobacter sp.]|nr:aminoglycoside phosphotransferase family protein [Ktedonosporobacter sp.]